MKNLILLFVLLAQFSAFSQTTISGRVIDSSGEPLIGANVFIPSTYEGSNTDIDGNFSFKTSATGAQDLMTQYIGYLPDSLRIQVPVSNPITIKLRASVNKLSEVVVIAGATEASDTRKTAVLSSVDIVTTGATGDLVEALSVLPGSTPAGETGQLLVRGGAASETKAYINGLQVPKFYTSNIPDVASRSRFNPFDFKGITFATGGFSAQYGDALSAALILQSNNLPEQDRWSLGIMSLGGSVGHTKVWDKQAVSAAVNYTHLGLYQFQNKEAKSRFLKNPQNGAGQVGYWWENKKGGLLKIYAQGSTNAYSGQQESDSLIYGGTNLSISNKNLYAQAVYQQPDGANGLWEFGAAAAWDANDFGIDGFHNVLYQQNVQLRGKRSGNLWEVAKWTAGGTYQMQEETFSRGEEVLEKFDPNTRNSGAIFAEADWYVNKQWVVRTGLRYDKYDASAGQVSPRFQLSHLFSKDHQLALSAGRYVQRDIPQEAFGSALDFAPARADHLMLTYFKNWKRRLLRLEGYYKKYDNLVSGVDRNFSPFGNGYAKGIDLFFRDRQSIKNGDLWVSLSLIDSKRKWRNTTELSAVPFAANQVVSVVYKHYFPKPSLGISFTYRWHTGRPYQNPNEPGFYQQKSPHYHDLSANLSYLTNIKGHFTVLFISMTNVPRFDQVHTYRYGQQRGSDGQFPRTEVRNLFPSFPFIGMFMNINEKKENISVDDL